MTSRARRLVAELVGTGLLLAAVVGSGIMGERLAGGNAAVALLANSLATGMILAVLILSFGPVSGAHFNPVVTLVLAARGKFPRGEIAGNVAVQVCGAILGVLLAHAMFDLPILQRSSHARSGAGQVVSECVATFGLLVAIWACLVHRPQATPFAVGAYVSGAYWFTASTAFANPAVTVARTMTDTFAGIRAADAPAFVVAEIAGAALAALVLPWLLPERGAAVAGSDLEKTR